MPGHPSHLLTPWVHQGQTETDRLTRATVPPPSHSPAQPRIPVQVGVLSSKSSGSLYLGPLPALQRQRCLYLTGSPPTPRYWWQGRELGARCPLWLTLANSLLSEPQPAPFPSPHPSHSWEGWLLNQYPGAPGAVGSPAPLIHCICPIRRL